MNWRNRFSLKAFGERMMLMTYRFPIALTLLAALTLLLSLMVWHESISSSVYTPTLFYYLYGGILLDICLTLWGEECGIRTTSRCPKQLAPHHTPANKLNMSFTGS